MWLRLNPVGVFRNRKSAVCFRRKLEICTIVPLDFLACFSVVQQAGHLHPSPAVGDRKWTRMRPGPSRRYGPHSYVLVGTPLCSILVTTQDDRVREELWGTLAVRRVFENMRTRVRRVNPHTCRIHFSPESPNDMYHAHDDGLGPAAVGVGKNVKLDAEGQGCSEHEHSERILCGPRRMRRSNDHRQPRLFRARTLRRASGRNRPDPPQIRQPLPRSREQCAEGG